MAALTREQLLNDLSELKRTAELPRLFLDNYFSELRNEVDKEITAKLIDHQNNERKKKKYNEIWQKMIAKISPFEEECINSEWTLSGNLERINAIEAILNGDEPTDLDAIQEMIENEEINIMKQLFKNKTIIFLDRKEEFDEMEDGFENCLD